MNCKRAFQVSAAGYCFALLATMSASAQVYPPTLDVAGANRTAAVQGERQAAEPAYTGFDSATALRVGAGLLLLGGFAVSASRRRQHADRRSAS